MGLPHRKGGLRQGWHSTAGVLALRLSKSHTCRDLNRDMTHTRAESLIINPPKHENRDRRVDAMAAAVLAASKPATAEDRR